MALIPDHIQISIPFVCCGRTRFSFIHARKVKVYDNRREKAFLFFLPPVVSERARARGADRQLFNILLLRTKKMLYDDFVYGYYLGPEWHSGFASMNIAYAIVHFNSIIGNIFINGPNRISHYLFIYFSSNAALIANIVINFVYGSPLRWRFMVEWESFDGNYDTIKSRVGAPTRGTWASMHKSQSTDGH